MKEIKKIGTLKCVDEETGEVSYVEIATNMKVVSQTDTTIVLQMTEPYRGCQNCKHQISPLRACKWLENGGDGVVHLICPHWEMKGLKNE